MFRLALVQNESEMLRYGWADIRPFLSTLEYGFDSFTAENIEDLFIGIRRGLYDCIIIATNACNDVNVLDRLIENKELISDFLAEDKGIFLSFQMRLTDRERTGFLPDKLDIQMLNRPEVGVQGELAVEGGTPKHVLLRYPNKIKKETLIFQCLHNEFVKSLYKGYVCPLDPSKYDSLVWDRKYKDRRDLVLSLRQDLVGRIVISTIVFDWQSHKGFLENSIRFVVEGQPFIAVMEKKGANSSVDFQYLLENLKFNKIPHRVYQVVDFENANFPFDVHKTFIIDPSWSLDEVKSSQLMNIKERSGRGSKIIMFDKGAHGQPIVSQIGGIENVEVMLGNSIAWIESQFNEGRWQNSFWATFDVLDLLVWLKKPVDHYRSQILAKISPHNIGGSYDEVMGATCALLKIYFWLLGKGSNEYKRTLKWIRQRLSQVSFYERCAALSTLQELSEKIEGRTVADIRHQVIADAQEVKEELRIYRGVQTLFTFNHYNDAKQLAESLFALQEPNGCWVNTSRTGSILFLLLKIQSVSEEPSSLHDQMIYMGINYLKDKYNPISGSWNNDVPSTAKALKAIVEFEKKVSFPIDELLGTLKRHRENEKHIQAIDLASSTNERLRKHGEEVEKSLKEEIDKRNRLRKIVFWVLFLAVPFASLEALMVLYAIYSKKSIRKVLVG